MNHINEDIQQVLADIFQNTQRADKIRIECDATSRSITVIYEDLDDEWFNELIDNGA